MTAPRADDNIEIERSTCQRCDGARRIPRIGAGFTSGEREGATDPCPSCKGLGYFEVARIKQSAIDRLKEPEFSHSTALPIPTQEPVATGRSSDAAVPSLPSAPWRVAEAWGAHEGEPLTLCYHEIRDASETQILSTWGAPNLPLANAVAALPDLLDLARNAAGTDERLMNDIDVIRAAFREYRDQARAILDKMEGRS